MLSFENLVGPFREKMERAMHAVSSRFRLLNRPPWRIVILLFLLAAVAFRLLEINAYENVKRGIKSLLPNYDDLQSQHLPRHVVDISVVVFSLLAFYLLKGSLVERCYGHLTSGREPQEISNGKMEKRIFPTSKSFNTAPLARGEMKGVSFSDMSGGSSGIPEEQLGTIKSSQKLQSTMDRKSCFEDAAEHLSIRSHRTGSKYIPDPLATESESKVDEMEWAQRLIHFAEAQQRRIDKMDAYLDRELPILSSKIENQSRVLRAVGSRFQTEVSMIRKSIKAQSRINSFTYKTLSTMLRKKKLRVPTRRSSYTLRNVNPQNQQLVGNSSNKSNPACRGKPERTNSAGHYGDTCAIISKMVHPDIAGDPELAKPFTEKG